MNVVIPLDLAAGSVLAYTIKTSAVGPLVHHILLPFKIYLSPFFTARVWRLTTSDPEPGSLMDRAPTHSPLISLGKYFFFCSGVPFNASWFIFKFECAP